MVKPRAKTNSQPELQSPLAEDQPSIEPKKLTPAQKRIQTMKLKREAAEAMKHSTCAVTAQEDVQGM